MTASEMFDKAGELWKVWLNLFWCTKNPRLGGSEPEPCLLTHPVAVTDFQLMHSSRITPPPYVSPPTNKDWLSSAASRA